MEHLTYYENSLEVIRYICLGLLFLWSFYQAFISERLSKRVLFSGLTFTTIVFATLVSDVPPNIYRTLFYINIGLLVVYAFIQECRTERFADAFTTVSAMRKRLLEITHPTQKPNITNRNKFTHNIRH